MVKSGIISLLGSLALPVIAFRDLEQMPESWCVTYLSTYLVPISAATSSPAESSLPGIDSSTSLDISVTLNPSSSLSLSPGVTSSVVTTEVETTPPSSTTGPSTLDGQVVFRVVPNTPDNNRLRRRDLGGFIGSPSEICDNANVFNLLDGQLLEGNVPIYFNGEDYKVFGGQQGPVPSGAITRTFFRDGDILRFQSSRIIPNGEAGFCQTPSDGVVYITFSSQPPGCIAVQLSAIGVQQCVNGDVTSSVAATSEAQQFTSASSLGPIISIPSSSDELPPGVSTIETESKPLVVTTEPNGAVTTQNPITQPIPSSTFRWSNMSSSFQPPPETSKSSIVPFSTFIFTSDSSTFVDVISSTEIVEPESSTAQELTSSTADFPASEIGTTTEEASTTAEATTSAAEETTTETSIVETTVNLTTEESTTISTTQETTDTTTTTTTTEVLTTESTTQQTSGTTSQETTTEISTSEESTTETTSQESTTETTSKESTSETTSEETTAESTTEGSTIETTTQETTTDATTEESTTEDPTTTTFTSTLDSTTETTTEAATTTTTAASQDIICPSSPQQCIDTFQIQCDTVLGGIPLTDGSSTLEECSQACFNDPNCALFTHAGTQCFSSTNPSANQGSFAIPGWLPSLNLFLQPLSWVKGNNICADLSDICPDGKCFMAFQALMTGTDSRTPAKMVACPTDDCSSDCQTWDVESQSNSINVDCAEFTGQHYFYLGIANTNRGLISCKYPSVKRESHFTERGYVVCLVDNNAIGRSAENAIASFPMAAGSATETVMKLSCILSGLKSLIPLTTNFFGQKNALRAGGCELLSLLGEKAFLISHSLGSRNPLLLFNDCPGYIAGSISLEAATSPFWPYAEGLGGYAGSPWGLTNTPVTYDPPVSNPSELESESVGKETLAHRNCYLRVEPAHKLPQVNKVPHVLLTGEASVHITYDHYVIGFLKQAGGKPEWIKLGDWGNGHFLRTTSKLLLELL
ncbi:fusarubin cluster-esterase [Fusarium tjaetaba]|uniref:Fusarubin cluster-esterase n=1 Tax=Fusarium tjaetaba TaxID=1567544 RepID=A0A8H5RTU1_9HYPO|nr:fusarubin cluster-esterase [Fusarium tjaetaba]KAF5639493.1 fusarubin cluster-esterase [Fusarium tjaetaba]